MPELIPFLNKNDIDNMVARVARRISSDYQDRELILIGILKGAFVFLSDLVRHLTIPVKLDFIRVCSYGSDVSSSGNIRLTKEIEIDVNNKDVPCLTNTNAVVKILKSTMPAMKWLKDSLWVMASIIMKTIDI